MWAFTGISLFLESLLAFVIMLHFGMTAALLGRERVLQMPSFFLSAVLMFLQVLGATGAKDLPNLLQPSWVTQGRAAAAMVGASCTCL